MPRGDKSSYTDKQKRQAEHIEEGYEQRGVPQREASAAPGQPSTRKPTAARRAAPAAAQRKTTRPRVRAAGLAARHRRTALWPNAHARRKRRRAPASAAPREGAAHGHL
jgi:hypothetical protein